MNDLISVITSQLQGGALSSIARQIGADDATTSSAVSAAIPVLISGLARNASKPEAADQLHQALEKDHDGSLLDDLGGFLGNPAAANGAGILGHIFGGRQPKVEEGVAQGTGLGAGQSAMLLQILAPIVMAALGKMMRSNQLDSGGLAGTLRKQAPAAGSGGLLGGLVGMLDADGDGSVVDDLGKLAGQFFSKKQ